jgi:hypothetical protein
MKRLALSLALMCAVALPTLAQAAPSGPTPKPTPPPHLDQSTAVNSSRSNIKNNLIVETPSPTRSGVNIPNNLQIVQGSGGTLRCTAGGMPCTQDQAKALAAALGKQSAIKSLTIAKDGSLLCNGTHCTAAHIPDLDSAAHAIQMMRKSGGDPHSSAPQY